MTAHRHSKASGQLDAVGKDTILLPNMDEVSWDNASGLARIVRERNAQLAKVSTNGRRYGLLPFPDVSASMRELAQILDQDGFDGVCIVPFASGRALDEAEFAPLLAEIERRGASLLLHPMESADHPLDSMRALDSLLAYARLCYYGSMDSMKNASMILAHTGGIEYFLADNTGMLYYLQASRWKMGRFMADYAIRKHLRGVEMLREIETTE